MSRRFLGMVCVFTAVAAGVVVVAPVLSAPVVAPVVAPVASPDAVKIAPKVEHHHSVAIPKGQAVPKITLQITPDAMKGWNMNIQTENFIFAPERVGQSSKTTEGHAHFFLNGKKIARLYGPWAHIPSLPKGKNELKVSLNTNMHEDLTEQGKVIEATTIVEVP
jgi:hypothetical protein